MRRKFRIRLINSLSCIYRATELDKATLDVYFLPHDIQRLEAYARNQVEFRLILDLVTDVSFLYFQGRIQGFQADSLQKVHSMGLQTIHISIISFSTGNSPGIGCARKICRCHFSRAEYAF